MRLGSPVSVRNAAATGVLAALGISLTAGCGRIGFDARDDAGGVTTSDAPPRDEIVAGLRVWLKLDADDLRLDSVSGQRAECTACPTATAGPRAGAGVFTDPTCLTLVEQPVFRGSELTLAAWVRGAPGNRGTVVGKSVSGETTTRNSYELWQRDDTEGYFNTSDGTGNDVLTFALEAGRLQHWAATFRADRKRVYVDGVEVGSEVAAFGQIGYDDSPLRVGCDLDEGTITEFYDGELDDVRLYDRELTPAEIAVLAQP